MNISIIVAVASNNAIGLDNQLIWRMPADLRFFQKLTMGHTLIMGSKTFESIGKPLKGRTTIVLSRRKGFDAMGCQVAGSLPEAIGMAATDQHVFVAGGAAVYKQAIMMRQVGTIFLTRIHASFEADAFFPEIDHTIWECVSNIDHDPDPQNPHPYSFQVYRRRDHDKG